MKLSAARSRLLEWSGAATAVAYSLLIAANLGVEFLGFSLLLLSACLLAAWAWAGGHRGIFLLQVFYAAAAVLGMVRWF